MLREFRFRVVLAAAGLIASASSTIAQDADELSKQLANPVASLISVPFQSNFEWGGGADDSGFAYTLNIQPVIPISISEDWNLISRTILPVAYRDYLPPPDGNTFGLGDITQSLFFSPKAPGLGGLIWGVGPAFLVPTATDDVLGSGKFGVGPTGVALIQRGPWTVGALANHIWSVAGEDDREEVNQTFLQPFVAYQFGHGTSLTLNTESSYDWVGDQWTVPINLSVQQVFKLGDQAMSFQVGGKYYAEAPEGGPQWGIRTTLTLLFPNK
ncbi:transporter [Mesorhizobium sp. BAC0120]|uniref:transporter n=1 Tax=Mesorhizobium sp. BAC0120 TaxID=3090670 RepID=UPI00298CE7D8|nr:transporter [Mesorhizobium sp. BAC0120]MDW6021084.1 transporter [Mesorhizobium sp. BAC0120]